MTSTKTPAKKSTPAKKATAAKPAPAKTPAKKAATPAAPPAKKAAPAAAAKKPPKPSGLGKGIAALISPATGDRADMLALTVIRPAADNVRGDLGDLDELADSIAVHGLIQPILVREIDDAFGVRVGYEVVAGHRRHAAIEQLAKAGRWAKDRLVPVQVRAGLDDRGRLAMMLVENLHRADLNPIDEATGYFRLTTEFGMTQRDLAAQVSRSQAHISQRIALLKLPAEVVNGIRTGAVGVDIAQRLTKLPDKVVLNLTDKGTANPSTYDIQAAENRVAADTATAAFRKRLDEIGVKVLALKNTWDRPAGHTMTSSLWRSAELDGLHGLEADIDVAVLIPNAHVGTCRCDIYRPTVRPDVTGPGASDSDDVELSPHERAIRAWQAECDRLRAEHKTAVDAYEATEREMLAGWARQQTAKDVARWAMLSLLGNTWAIENARPRLDVLLGLPTAALAGHVDDAIVDDVRAYAHESAANLVTVCALIAREWEDAESGSTLADVETSWAGFAGGIAKPALALPPYPGSTTSVTADVDDEDLDEEDLEDGEADAIREARRAAGDTEGGDLP